MSDPYEEIIQGETLLRSAPGDRHERICARLHARFAVETGLDSPSRLLSPRSVVQMSSGTILRPDLALVAAATGKIWMAVEIINSNDHRVDTVIKKAIYEDANLPRLWMVDPRYDNVEIYHGTPYGLALRKIVAGRELIEETLLPGFNLTVAELFAG